MRLAAFMVALVSPSVAAAPSAADYAADAVRLDVLIANYAYVDDLPDRAIPSSPVLEAERAAVHDRDTLLHYAEDKLTALADHHAATGRSFPDDWALVPSYSDLWVESVGERYRITAVRAGSPADAAGIKPGEELSAVSGTPTEAAVPAFWSRLGLAPSGERRAYAARVLAAGRRDRGRVLTIGRDATARTVTLPNLYTVEPPSRTPVSVVGSTIRFNNSLGDAATIAAFDAAMAAMPPRAPITLDLTDTPSGGNTSVARAVMGWFVRRASSYQVHRSIVEEHATGIARQWIEQVLPRTGKFHPGAVRVRVGRWTGSMGEGVAIGFAAFGMPVCGGPMAGLRGAVEDFTLPASGLSFKLPTERLYTMTGLPRERYEPPRDQRCR